MQRKILILTDHFGHSVQNSLYSIVNEMVSHHKAGQIVVASRSDPKNQRFFNYHEFAQIFAIEISESIKFNPDTSAWTSLSTHHDTADFDIVFLRLPRPITDAFLYQVELHFNEQVIINRPSGIIATSNKEFLIELKEVCPPIQLCRSLEEAISFKNNFDLVLKPLKEYGGKGIVKWTEKIEENGQIFSTEEGLKHLDTHWPEEGYLAMKYLKNVTEGDKRILVVDGQIMASSLRLPKKGSWICNVAQGGTSVASEANSDELEIIQKIHSKIKKQGILIYGVDTLCDDNGKRVLSEINTLSIGGFPQAQKQQGKPIIKLTLDKFFEHADQ